MDLPSYPEAPFPGDDTMYALATDHLLYYKITPEPGGLALRIWETPTAAARNHGEYLYIINVQVGSMAEARTCLANHLALNGGALVCDQAELPYKGKIRLLAFPTWDGQS